MIYATRKPGAARWPGLLAVTAVDLPVVPTSKSVLRLGCWASGFRRLLLRRPAIAGNRRRLGRNQDRHIREQADSQPADAYAAGRMARIVSQQRRFAVDQQGERVAGGGEFKSKKSSQDCGAKPNARLVQ